MASKKKNDPDWAAAKTKCRMNAEDVEMAKRLGFSPRTLMANNSSTRHEQWKAPTKIWVREMYEKRFGQLLSKPPQLTTLKSGPQFAEPESGSDYFDTDPFE